MSFRHLGRIGEGFLFARQVRTRGGYSGDNPTRIGIAPAEERLVVANDSAVRHSLPSRIACNCLGSSNLIFSTRHCSEGLARVLLTPIATVTFVLNLISAPAFARPKPSKSLTVERIYGAPSLSGYLTQGVEWSPDAKRISFLDRSASGLEMWTMDAATGERKLLVNSEVLAHVMQPERKQTIQSTGLGRVQPENYRWSPFGDSLLFIGGTNLVLLDLKTMSSKPLVTGDADIEDPKFSPDGKWVSYVRDFNLWVANVATGKSKPLTTGGSEEILKAKLDFLYPEELELGTAYWWSPDSSKIAYYEMDERQVTRYSLVDMSSPLGATEYERFPQAGEPNPVVRARVVSIDGGETKWMDTGANTDVYLARLVWLRDGRRVAIERLNRAQTRLDLLFCDSTGGACKTILTDTDKYWINLSDDLYFFADNQRFLWSSERTGFRHYYLYEFSGKQLEQLTSGDWGITGTGGFGPGTDSHPAVDEARGLIYFMSNKDDVLGTQIYRLSLNDKSITRVTKENGTHEALFAPDASGFVDTYSNAMAPPRRDLYGPDASRVAVVDENKVPELSEYQLARVEFLSLAANDGTKLYASMIRPLDFDASKRYPVLICVYGGPGIQVVRDQWDGDDYLWLEMMAQKGYIVFRLDNRGSYQRGHVFETPIYHHFGKIELEDQLSGVKYLKSLPYVDASRIGIAGWSYGGTMTLVAMFNAPEIFKAGVSVAPVTDWRLYDTAYTERYMGRPQDNPNGYDDSSQVNHVAGLQGNLLLVHSTGDDNVHFSNTAELLNDMIRAGKYPSNLIIFPGRGHGINDLPARIELYKKVTEFVLNNL
jgi:dipeptidyl-peptidase-4